MRLSVVTSPEELKGYFGKGKAWKKGEWKEDGSFHGETTFFRIDLKPTDSTYRVEVKAVDDPSDSETEVTENPVKFLAEFLGRGVPGGEHFEKMSASPSDVAGVLRAVAISLRVMTANEASRAVRRVALLAGSRAVVVKIAGGGSVDGIEKMMKSKGWEVRRGDSEDEKSDGPKLHVDISGVYEATIVPETTKYEYKFSLVDHPELDREGVTDDPIIEVEDFMKDPDVVDAYHDVKSKSAEKPSPQGLKKTEKVSPQNMKKTVPMEEPLS